MKAYLKACLECWATGEDEVRIKAVVALRRVMACGDEGVGNLVFKVCNRPLFFFLVVSK